jgi:hypothetical protein
MPASKVTGIPVEQSHLLTMKARAAALRQRHQAVTMNSRGHNAVAEAAAAGVSLSKAQNAGDTSGQVPMEPVTTCVIKIYCKSDAAGRADYTDILRDLDDAVESQSYEVVCFGDHDHFSISDAALDDRFATFIQFNFTSQLGTQEDIAAKIRKHIAGTCCIDPIHEKSRYRLLLIETCEISFK